jgi:penicillin V acylase-like amidase (Ntn superfamily)
VVVVSCAALAAGCGRFAVRPNEKEHLADRTMQFDPDTQEAAADEHISSNREGSSGGSGSGGGGCGCN